MCGECARVRACSGLTGLRALGRSICTRFSLAYNRKKDPKMLKINFVTKPSKKPAALLLLSGLCLGSPALGDVIYQQDFEEWNNTDGLWSNQTTANLGGSYTTVLGRFSTTTVNLNIRATLDNSGSSNGGGNPSDGNSFNITLDSYEDHKSPVPVFDNSSGGLGQPGPSTPPEPDTPRLGLGGAVNGVPRFSEFLHSSSYPEGFNFREPDETPADNAYDARWEDSIYRNITVLFDLDEEVDALDIDFIGNTSQDLADESWGLDNIMIEQVSSFRTVPVPVPGTVAIFGMGLGLVGRRKR